MDDVFERMKINFFFFYLTTISAAHIRPIVIITTYSNNWSRRFGRSAYNRAKYRDKLAFIILYLLLHRTWLLIVFHPTIL